MPGDSVIRSSHWESQHPGDTSTARLQQQLAGSRCAQPPLGVMNSFWNVAFFIHNSRLAVNTLGQFPAFKSCRMTRLSTLVKPSANQRCWTFRCWAISGFKRMHEVRTLCNQSSSWYSDWMLRTCFHTCLGTQQSTDGVGTHQIQQLVQTDCQFVQQKSYQCQTQHFSGLISDWFPCKSTAIRCKSEHCHLIAMVSGELERKGWLSSHNSFGQSHFAVVLLECWMQSNLKTWPAIFGAETQSPNFVELRPDQCDWSIWQRPKQELIIDMYLIYHRHTLMTTCLNLIYYHTLSSFVTLANYIITYEKEKCSSCSPVPVRASVSLALSAELWVPFRTEGNKNGSSIWIDI